MYRLDDEERADIREGVAEIERGEVAQDEHVKAIFEALRRG
jgi:predicted transcriptional regulator